MVDQKRSNSYYHPKEYFSVGIDAARYDLERSYSMPFQEVHWELWENTVRDLYHQPTMTQLGYLSWSPPKEYTYGADDLQLLDDTPYGSRRSESTLNSFGSSSTISVPSGSTVNGYQNAPNIVLPVELDSNFVVPFAAPYAMLSQAGYAPRLPTTIPTLESGEMVSGYQQTPRDTIPMGFEFNYSSYPPSSHQTYVDQPSSIPVPRNERVPCRRRGPDANAIEKRRKNIEGRSYMLLFCMEQGCNNVGFTTRGSLKRHVKDKHSGREHLCPECLRPFADSTSVGRHKRKKHE